MGSDLVLPLPAPTHTPRSFVVGRTRHAPRARPNAGRNWVPLLTGWLVQMGFALVVMDLAICYIRFRILVVALSSRKLARRTFGKE